MKNLLKKSLIILMLMVMLPLSSFLVACGATAGETANTVAFVSDIYDEETGKAIFEVDLGVPTELKFKCNPSTAKNKADYTIPVEGQSNAGYNRSRFTFEDGIITVNYDDFEQIEIKINVNGYTDQCIVRLKEYPISIRPAEADVIINSGASHTMMAYGTFELADGTTEERLLLEKDYKFSVVSENEQVVDVPNSSRLTVCSLLQSAGSTKVKVTLNDQSGKTKKDVNQKDISFYVNFTVVEVAKEGFLVFDNFNKFVEDGDAIAVDANSYEANANGEYELHYSAFFVSELGTFIENIGDYRGSSSDNNYITFDDENQLIKIKSNVDLKLDVTIYTDLFKIEQGVYSTLQINFEIYFTAKTTI